MSGTPLWRFAWPGLFLNDFNYRIKGCSHIITIITSTMDSSSAAPAQTNLQANTYLPPPKVHVVVPELRQKKIDTYLNKMFLDITVFSVIGWTLGLGAGVFFRNKAPVRSLLAGVGGGYGFVSNRMSIKSFVWYAPIIWQLIAKNIS